MFTLVARPLLLSTFFWAGWMRHGAPMDNEVQGQTSSAISLVLNNCSKEQSLWGSPQIKIVSSYFVEKWKNEKWKINCIWDQEGHKGGEKSVLICKAFFVFVKQIFSWHINFFHFGISNCFVIAKEEFQKNIKYRGIILIIWTRIWKIWLIHDFFIPDEGSDTWLTPRTGCGHLTEQILQKYGQPSNSVNVIFGHVPVLRTYLACLGHFQLSISLHFYFQQRIFICTKHS